MTLRVKCFLALLTIASCVYLYATEPTEAGDNSAPVEDCADDCAAVPGAPYEPELPPTSPPTTVGDPSEPVPFDVETPPTRSRCPKPSLPSRSQATLRSPADGTHGPRVPRPASTLRAGTPAHSRPEGTSDARP